MTDLVYALGKELTDRLQTLLDGLSRGTPTDYAEYCTLVGEIRGLRYGLDALNNFRQQIETEAE